MNARVLSVNIGRVAPLTMGERTVMSGIVKRAVDGPVPVRALGLAGDEQADPTVHGGLAKAVYMYPAEHYAFWNTVHHQVRHATAGLRADGLIPYDTASVLPWGACGENLTVAGLAEADLYIGDVLRIGSAELVVTSPRIPCDKFNAVMGTNQAVRLMVRSGYCGWYLEVRTPGTLAAGDGITLHPGERDRSLSISEQFRLQTRRNRGG